MNHTIFMHMAEAQADKSLCQDRQVGAVIVLQNGQTFAACNRCLDAEIVVHAEIAALNLVLNSGINPFEISAIYVTCRPCKHCTDSLLSFGVKAVYYRDSQPEMSHLQKFVNAGVLVDGRWVMGQVQDSWAKRNNTA